MEEGVGGARVAPGQDDAGVLSRLRRGTVVSFVLHAVGVGLLFAMHAVFARAVGAGGYGSFASALAITGLLAVLVPLGWPTALLRLISEYREKRQWGLLRGALSRAYATTFLASVVVALALLGLSYLVPGDAATGLRYAALLLPLAAFVGLRRKALRAFGRLKASIVLEEVMLPVLAIAGVLLVGFASVNGIVAAYALSALAVFFLSNLWLRRSLPEEVRAASPEFKTRVWMALALPMAFGGVGQVFLNRADVLVLTALASSEAVGTYNAAARIAVLGSFSLSAVNGVFAPMMASAFHGGRRGQAARVLRRAMLLSTAGALPIVAGMLLFPGFLLGLFGAEFVEAAPVLRVLAVGQLVNAATGPVGFALLMTGREKAFAATMAVVAAATVVGHLVAIPAYGALGAAVVTAASVAVLNCWQLALAGRIGRGGIR